MYFPWLPAPETRERALCNPLQAHPAPRQRPNHLQAVGKDQEMTDDTTIRRIQWGNDRITVYAGSGVLAILRGAEADAFNHVMAQCFAALREEECTTTPPQEAKPE
jgi:hypothetical protein